MNILLSYWATAWNQITGFWFINLQQWDHYMMCYMVCYVKILKIQAEAQQSQNGLNLI